MKRAIEKCWRDSASLIVLAKRNIDGLSSGNTGDSNYDILLQTRTFDASFSNGVVFPGGVKEEADASERWLHLLGSFGFDQSDFETLHRAGAPITPIFADNPIKRHIALRITAIRETFEELGLLICSSKHKTSKIDYWANFISDIDLKYWQKRVSENPSELLNLCKEYNCYPDIWNLHYWSNWLSPVLLPKRFDTAFFIAALENKPTHIKANSEVHKVEWASPQDTLERNRRGEVELYPPQSYELNRLSYFKDIEKLNNFARERSSHGDELFYPVRIRAKDGIVFLLPGDYLYPSNVDLNSTTVIKEDKTVISLRETGQTLHRFETDLKKSVIVRQNYIPKNHINMGDQVIPAFIKIHTQN
ncbi:acyl-coenzyme A diphosphatase NUDT19-like [Vanessa tameamea]|uniref:Acyl-coenzyme A diphosphatase NUDT19-like n=1 Tax=Vanessa tameamea TaxID=334116 RepID=A0A8B8HP15_VANTA